MNTSNFLRYSLSIVFIMLLTLMSEELAAQRLRHAPAGGKSISRPAATGNRAPAANRTGTSNGRTKATTKQGVTKNKPNVGTRDVQRPNTRNKPTSSIKSRTTNKTVNRNVDKSRNVNRTNVNRNVNVTVNRRNTIVVPSRRPYRRPPYAYGGFFYFSHHPYYYHPYVSYSWGPYYYPWGSFVATLAATAIIVSIIDDSGNDASASSEEYNYENGTYYIKTEDGFVAVQAPVGAQVPNIPKESVKVEVAEEETNYYYAGAFYAQNEEGYIVVPATAGTIVPNLPEGGEEVKVGEQTFVQFGETYYQPIQVDGKDMYEIVEVKPSDSD